MAGGTHKLVLAYAPAVGPRRPRWASAASRPTSQRVLPSWTVKTLDLNLAVHQALFRSLDEQPILSGAAFPEGLLGDIALAGPTRSFAANIPTNSTSVPIDTTSTAISGCIRAAGAHDFRTLEQVYEGRVAMPDVIEKQVERVLGKEPTSWGSPSATRNKCGSAFAWPKG